jgi:hypothetical protein
LGSIRILDFVEFRNIHSLWSNDPAQRMTPGQHDAAMIDHLRWGHCVRQSRLKFCSLDQCPAARRTPIRHSFFAEHRPALAANPFHAFQITGSAHAASGSVH